MKRNFLATSLKNLLYFRKEPTKSKNKQIICFEEISCLFAEVKLKKIPCDYLYSAVKNREIVCDFLSKAGKHMKSPCDYLKASRKFKEFWYNRLRYFVKHSCAQETIRESSKSYDQRK